MGKKKECTVYLNPDLAAWLDQQAIEAGISFSSFTATVLSKYRKMINRGVVVRNDPETFIEPTDFEIDW